MFFLLNVLMTSLSLSLPSEQRCVNRVIVLAAAESVPVSDNASEAPGLTISSLMFLMDYFRLPASPRSS